MSEYRFTGPFYNDTEDPAYESADRSFYHETVTPPPVQAEESKKKKTGFGKTI